jgi:hypothetical protein
MKKIKSLNVIDNLTVESPCNEPWEKMQGSNKRRHCDSCKHSVTNLSMHTRKEAELIISKLKKERFCVRYTHNPDGSIKFKPNPTLFTHAGAFLTLTLTAILAFFGISTATNAEDKNSTHEMGKIMVQVTPISTVTPVPTPELHTMGMIAPPPEKSR